MPVLAEDLPPLVFCIIQRSQAPTRPSARVQHGLPSIPAFPLRLIFLVPPFADDPSPHAKRSRFCTDSATRIRGDFGRWFVVFAVLEALVRGTGKALHGFFIHQARVGKELSEPGTIRRRDWTFHYQAARGTADGGEFLVGRMLCRHKAQIHVHGLAGGVGRPADRHEAFFWPLAWLPTIGHHAGYA
jgi:hypothetical protein